MAIPPALQRYANDVVKGTYKEMNKLWSACQAKNADLAKEMLKLPTAGRLDGRIMDALRRVHDSLRKGAANGNNRGHRAAPKAVSLRAPLKAVSLRVRVRVLKAVSLRVLPPDACRNRERTD